MRNAAEHREKMTRKQAAAELRRYGLRYDGASSGRSGRGYNAHNTYIELRNATQAAGNGFLSRVNKQIEELRKEGNDSVYNVTQAVKEDIRKQGLLNVEYSNGRKVDISSYARMAARSARMESANIAAFGRALETGPTMCVVRRSIRPVRSARSIRAAFTASAEGTSDFPRCLKRRFGADMRSCTRIAVMSLSLSGSRP